MKLSVMSKIITTFLLFLLTHFIFAQNTTVKQDITFIAKYMIYPGCEKFKENNQQLQNCFSRTLQTNIYEDTNKFIDVMIERKITKASGIIGFSVSTEGKITNIEILNESHKGLGNIIKTAIIKEARKLEKNNLLIEPAKLDDGKAVELKVQFPFQYSVEF